MKDVAARGDGGVGGRDRFQGNGADGVGRFGVGQNGVD